MDTFKAVKLPVVEKVTISRLVVGAIIGKGGSGITKLEKDHQGVTVNVSSDDGTVTLVWMTNLWITSGLIMPQ